MLKYNILLGKLRYKYDLRLSGSSIFLIVSSVEFQLLVVDGKKRIFKSFSSCVELTEV